MKKSDKNREPGYYWITPVTLSTLLRQPAYWSGKSWWIVGIGSPITTVKDINEKKLKEDI